jgi:hypothetical protein
MPNREDDRNGAEDERRIEPVPSVERPALDGHVHAAELAAPLLRAFVPATLRRAFERIAEARTVRAKPPETSPSTEEQPVAFLHRASLRAPDAVPEPVRRLSGLRVAPAAAPARGPQAPDVTTGAPATGIEAVSVFVGETEPSSAPMVFPDWPPAPSVAAPAGRPFGASIAAPAAAPAGASVAPIWEDVRALLTRGAGAPPNGGSAPSQEGQTVVHVDRVEVYVEQAADVGDVEAFNRMLGEALTQERRRLGG